MTEWLILFSAECYIQLQPARFASTGLLRALALIDNVQSTFDADECCLVVQAEY
jgi:hypothetical protein